jgi:hypothetical protein
MGVVQEDPVAYVYSAPDHAVRLLRGSALKDPGGLLGRRKFVRHIKVRKRSDIDEKIPCGTLLPGG